MHEWYSMTTTHKHKKLSGVMSLKNVNYHLMLSLDILFSLQIWKSGLLPLEDIVSNQSASIESLQETDVELEQRVEELKDYIIGELLSCDIVMNIYMCSSMHLKRMYRRPDNV